jgi:biotin transporter BioY
VVFRSVARESKLLHYSAIQYVLAVLAGVPILASAVLLPGEAGLAVTMGCKGGGVRQERSRKA